ncbi:amidohydrolase family protein [Salinimicrobium terrae]|uniref:amidohydrolase family protein n=1 Tax=Salinimicrobium terrae TaxID=470866 RepID=UPI000424629A|nr:amidohydrolase family protein [Salinimicrobium terrae]
MKKIIWVFLFIFTVLGPIQAQDINLKPVTGTVAVTNVNIIPSPGKYIENATVLVRDGLITAVGTNVSVPPGARIIKSDSMYLYPGFILGMSHAGITMPKQEERPEVKDPGNPPNDIAGITPGRLVNPYLEVSHKSIEDWRASGFTMAQTAPSGGMLPGKGAMVLLKGKSGGDLILKNESFLYATFDGARRMYPSNILGVMAKYRELYRQAEYAQMFRDSYLSNPTGKERPMYNETLEAFYPVIQKQIPILFKAQEILPAQRAILLKEELDFNLVLTDLKQGWDLTQEIKNSNSRVLFSLELPEWKEKKKDTVKEEESSVEKLQLDERKEEFLKKYYGQMGEFAAAGILFGFSGLDAKPGEVQKALQKMVENGLSEDAALAALTTNPASMFGINRLVGTVENGKMANLVISSKPYFEKDAKIKYVMVEGELFKYEEKEASKADPETIAKATGTWDYKADTPDGPITGTLILQETDGVLSGTISNSLTGQESVLQDILLTEDRLSFNFDVVITGERMEVIAVLTLSEDTFEGSLSSSGQQYTMKGTKSPNGQD